MNIHAGPWSPPGSPEAPGFVLEQQERDRAAHVEAGMREQVRYELESSGEIDSFIQSKIDERVKEPGNGE